MLEIIAKRLRELMRSNRRYICSLAVHSRIKLTIYLSLSHLLSHSRIHFNELHNRLRDSYYTQK